MEAIILTKDQYNELLARLEALTIQLSTKVDTRKETFIEDQEFIQQMKISRRTAKSWRDEGKISFSQLGHKIYYKLTDIDKLLNKNYKKAFSNKRM